MEYPGSDYDRLGSAKHNDALFLHRIELYSWVDISKDCPQSIASITDLTNRMPAMLMRLESFLQSSLNTWTFYAGLFLGLVSN